MSMPVLLMDPLMKQALDRGFRAAFGGEPARYFSAPGRTEIGGNHTDHQRGRVLAAAVNLDTVAAVCENGTDVIRILSKGYPQCQINVKDLTPRQEEINTTPALIRGVVARFAQLGCVVRGFDAYCESTVLPGSGLSSSAAYEVLIGTIINHLFFGQKASQAEVAQIGQYAENVFFGKPCGLMDQTASAVGNLVTIDFFDKDHSVIKPVSFDFSACGHLKALEFAMDGVGVEAINLGTGNGISVLELVNAFNKANGMDLPYVIGPCREGDLPAFWADAEKAKNLLGWEATHSVEDMCRSAWNFAKNAGKQ